MRGALTSMVIHASVDVYPTEMQEQNKVHMCLVMEFGKCRVKKKCRPYYLHCLCVGASVTIIANEVILLVEKYATIVSFRKQVGYRRRLIL